MAEQDGVLQEAVRDGVEEAVPRWQRGQVEVKQPLQLAQRQHQMLPEGAVHKVPQLLGGRARGRSPLVTVNGAVRDGGGGRRVHGLVFHVADGFLLDPNAVSCSPRDPASLPVGGGVPLHGRLLLTCTLLGGLEALLPAHVHGFCNIEVTVRRTSRIVSRKLSMLERDDAYLAEEGS